VLSPMGFLRACGRLSAMDVLRPDWRMLPHKPKLTTEPDRLDPVWGAQRARSHRKKEGCMGIFTIIGVVVVVLFIVGYLGFR
jgi:hypothetical protein